MNKACDYLKTSACRITSPEKRGTQNRERNLQPEFSPLSLGTSVQPLQVLRNTCFYPQKEVKLIHSTVTWCDLEIFILLHIFVWFLFDAGHHFVLLVLNLRQSSCLSLWILAFSVIRYLLLIVLKFTIEVDGVGQWPSGYLARMRHWVLFPASQVKKSI